MDSLAPIPVIVGPTAGGKSALAMAMHRALAARGVASEIVTADAYQIYRGMDIGTAKPTREELAAVPHHLVDIVEPTERFTASDWLAAAERVITDCRGRGVVPIVVGGTHLYVKLLVDGMFEGPGADEALREELRAQPAAALRAELERVDAASARKLHPNDLRRTIRALEVFRLTGKPISQHQSQWDQGGAAERETVLIGLEWPSEAINPRINTRVKEMVERGLVAEARGLWEANRLGPQAREALGYKQFIDHFEGRLTLEEAIERIKIETRRFAKNQRTWLKRLRVTPRSVWIAAVESGEEERVSRAIGALGKETP